MNARCGSSAGTELGAVQAGRDGFDQVQALLRRGEGTGEPPIWQGAGGAPQPQPCDRPSPARRASAHRPIPIQPPRSSNAAAGSSPSSARATRSSHRHMSDRPHSSPPLPPSCRLPHRACQQLCRAVFLSCLLIAHEMCYLLLLRLQLWVCAGLATTVFLSCLQYTHAHTNTSLGGCRAAAIPQGAWQGRQRPAAVALPARWHARFHPLR